MAARFKGKVAIVTGAAHGMGRSHALGFAREGADVVVVDICRPIEDLKIRATGTDEEMNEVVGEIKALGRKSIGIKTDIREPGQVQGMFDKVLSEFGRIDILVNNAGVFVAGPIVSTPDEDVDTLVDVNLKGTFYCCKYVIPHMAKQKSGKIVNISSAAGLSGAPLMGIYSASKWGIIGLTQALAAELSHYNINVNAVCPGAVWTPLIEAACKAMAPGVEPRTVYEVGFCAPHFFRREIPPRDITNAILWLASEESRNITGIAVPVSAGSELRMPAPDPYFTV